MQPLETAKPQRADARRNRERILAAATACFSEHGRDAQIDDVARRAGVGVGTVYRHFPTKDALVLELARLRFERIAEIANEQVLVEDPWEAFAGCLTRFGERHAADAAIRDVVLDGTAMSTAAAERADLRAALDRIFARAHEAGVLRRDVTPDVVAPLMCALCGVLRAQHLPSGSWRVTLDLMLDGLRAR